MVALPTGLFSGQFADDWEDSQNAENDELAKETEKEMLKDMPANQRYSLMPISEISRISVTALRQHLNDSEIDNVGNQLPSEVLCAI